MKRCHGDSSVGHAQLMMSLHLSAPPQAYGGYLATMLLSSEEFTQLKCGAAVSPITDFEIYGRILRRTFPIMQCSPKPLTLLVLFCSVSVFRTISGLKDRFQSVHGESASLLL